MHSYLLVWYNIAEVTVMIKMEKVVLCFHYLETGYKRILLILFMIDYTSFQINYQSCVIMNVFARRILSRHLPSTLSLWKQHCFARSNSVISIKRMMIIVYNYPPKGRWIVANQMDKKTLLQFLLLKLSQNDAPFFSPFAKQWIFMDIPRYGSQSKHVKIAIHWFGKY